MHTWVQQGALVVVAVVAVAAVGSGGFAAGGRPAAASGDGNRLGLKTG